MLQVASIVDIVVGRRCPLCCAFANSVYTQAQKKRKHTFTIYVIHLI